MKFAERRPFSAADDAENGSKIEEPYISFRISRISLPRVGGLEVPWLRDRFVSPHIMSHYCWGSRVHLTLNRFLFSLSFFSVAFKTLFCIVVASKALYTSFVIVFCCPKCLMVRMRPKVS